MAVYITDEQLDKIEQIADAASPDPWTKGRMPESKDPIAYFAECHGHGKPDEMHIVCVPVDGKPIDEEARFTAITGNGPTSEANARFIAMARSAVPALVEEVRRLRAEIKAIAMRNGMPSSGRKA